MQNKVNRDYFKKFINLSDDDVGISYMNLNKEYGKVVIPKQPTIRFGITAYDNLGDKKGIIIFNICLKKFFLYFHNQHSMI